MRSHPYASAESFQLTIDSSTLHRTLPGSSDSRICFQGAARLQQTTIEGENLSCVQEAPNSQRLCICGMHSSATGSISTSVEDMDDAINSLLEDLVLASFNPAFRIPGRDISFYDPVRRLRGPLHASPPKIFMRKRGTLIGGNPTPFRKRAKSFAAQDIQ